MHLKTRVDGMAMIALLFMQTGEEEGEWADAKIDEVFAKSVAPVRRIEKIPPRPAGEGEGRWVPARIRICGMPRSERDSPRRCLGCR
ncbi:hypothetical protein GCM10027400_27360 [Pseudoxanthomonas daejeonensis]